MGCEVSVLEDKKALMREDIVKERLEARRREAFRDKRLDLIVKAMSLIVVAVFLSVAGVYGYFQYQQSKMTPVDIAARNLLAMIRENPENADLRVRLGEYYLHREKYDDAAEFFKQALRLEPSNQRAIIGLGLIYFETKKDNQAYEEFMKTIKINEGATWSKLNPVVEQAHYYAGLVMMRQKKYETAVGHFRQALDLNPNSSDVRTQLGKALLELKMYDRAIPEFERALKVDPVFAPAHYGLGVAYEKTDQTKKAIEAYQEALKSAPQGSELQKEINEAIYRLTGL